MPSRSARSSTGGAGFARGGRRRTPQEQAGRLADAALLGVLFVVPLVVGGRHAYGLFAYATLACVGAVAAAFTAEGRRRPSAAGLLVGGLTRGALVTQLIPLPAAWIAALCPDRAATLPMWSPGGGFGPWTRLSLTPAATHREALALFAHAALFYAAVTRLHSAERVRTGLAWLGGAAAVATLLALAGKAMGEAKLLGVYDYPLADFGVRLQGTFTNPNHFAHFLLLTVCGLPVLAASASRRFVRLAAAIATPVVLVAILATGSRGAAVALLASAMTAGAVAWRARALSRKHAAVGAVVVLALLGGLSVMEGERVAERLSDLATGDVERLDRSAARRSIWQANLEAFAASPWFGHGAGSHRFAHKRFFDVPYDREFTHAENGYLQIASERGLAGLVALAATLLLVGSWCVRAVARCASPTDAPAVIAVVAPLVASVTHSVVDFVWFAPALLGATVLLAAAARAIAHAAETVEATDASAAAAVPWTRVAGLALGGGVVLGGLAGPAVGAWHWDRYLRSSRTLTELTREVRAADDPDAEKEFIAHETERAIRLLRRVVQNDPHHARAWGRLSVRLLQRFEQGAATAAMPLGAEAFRDAALASQFATADQTRAWLQRAAGERAELLQQAHTTALRAVRLCPLLGPAYLDLASTAMLSPGVAVEPLVTQALAVWPHDGGVQTDAGVELFRQGDIGAATPLWRDAARRTGSHRATLVALFVSSAPASALVAALDPDPWVLGLAATAYGKRGDATDLGALADYAIQQAERHAASEPDDDAARRWRIVGSLCHRLGRHDEAVAACQRANDLSGGVFATRIALAKALRGAEQHAEADPHIRWCLGRRPDILYLHTWLADLAKKQTEVDRNRRRRRRDERRLASRPAAAPNAATTPDSPPLPPPSGESPSTTVPSR